MRKFILLLVLSLITCYTGYAQGIKFEEGTWEEMLAKAIKEDKLIFVDVYTQWCGPCKYVASEVFPDKNLGSRFNEQFINYKVDAESPEGKKFVKEYPVSGYPTFYFIDKQGKVINKLIGGKDVAGFLQEADMIDMYMRYGGIDSMQIAIKNGTASKNMLYDYYKSASEDVKPRALNLYLKSLSSEELIDVNNKLVDRISLYDKDLMFRLADEIVKVSHSDKYNDKKFKSAFTLSIVLPVHYVIGTFLQQSINQGNIEWFKELLCLKDAFKDFNGWLLDGDWIIRNERGFFYATSEYLKLCYMTQNRIKAEKFKIELQDYMSKLIIEKPIDSLWDFNERNYLEMLKKEGIKNKGDKYYFFERGSITAHNILKWTNYFWRESSSDKKTKQLCFKWINYVYYMNPYNSNVAILAANLIARIGNIKDGIKILETAIAKQKELKNDDMKLYRSLELNLKDLKNGKL